MKLTVTFLALAASVIAAPIAQGTYNDYGSYDDVPTPPVTNPPPPAGGYGSYGDYGDVPAPPVNNPLPPAGGYGTYGDYGAYKKG
ncbi:Nn.00g046500.m01.CDS01 [Neocucurbitaria sp. VM-36]